MALEETPLLSDDNDIIAKKLHHDAVYDRFSRLQKRTIVGLISLAGLSPCTYLPDWLYLGNGLILHGSTHIWVIHPVNTPNC